MMDTAQRIEMQERVIELLARALSEFMIIETHTLIRMAKLDALQGMGLDENEVDGD